MRISPSSRPVAVSIVALLCSAAVVQAQFRPALVGNGPKALVNEINTKKVAERTKEGAIVMFACFVDEKGKAHNATTYRGSGDFKALAGEVRNAIERSHFIPAAYGGKPFPIYFAGTAIFVKTDGQPRLRIFANQNADDIKRQSDFVAPQLIAGTDDWDSAKLLLEKARLYTRNGAVELSVTVDDTGHVKDLKVVSEDPTDFNFGRAALVEYGKARFTPGYRNGKATPCTFTYTQYVKSFIEPMETRLRASLIPPSD
jgi:hypothetical protein